MSLTPEDAETIIRASGKQLEAAWPECGGVTRQVLLRAHTALSQHVQKCVEVPVEIVRQEPPRRYPWSRRIVLEHRSA
jgi:hypothetical protein